MRIGLIARAEATGLSILTNEFWRHMKPAKTLIVDMTKRGGGPSTIDLNLYAGDPNVTVMDNSPYPDRAVNRNPVIDAWLDDLDVVFTAETPYDYYLFAAARERGIKTVLQPMFEFLEYFVDDTLPMPDLFAMPSPWRYDEVPFANKMLLPVPVARDRLPFRRRTEANVFFHNCGNQTMRDRNGTMLFMEAMRRIPKQYAIKAIIHSNKRLQNPVPQRIMVDMRVKPHYWLNYRDRFDVAIMPRKYAGLCLPLNEASSCGIPTIMSDTSPQNLFLPPEALMPCVKAGELTTRTLIDVMEVPVSAIVEKIVELHTNPALVADLSDKANEYAESISWGKLQPVYEEVLGSLL